VENGLLRSAKLAAGEETICNDEAATRTKQAVCLMDKPRLAGASAVAAALDSADSVIALGRKAVFS